MNNPVQITNTDAELYRLITNCSTSQQRDIAYKRIDRMGYTKQEACDRVFVLLTFLRCGFDLEAPNVYIMSSVQ